MKRVAAHGAPGGSARTGTEAKTNGFNHAITGPQTPAARPQAWTPGTCILDGDQIWPDCCD
ncbi:MAG: hypothetical protein JWQ75_2406 [Pseudarthrobacter sp.]|nr:hypothetical protein [Pseudarthrobacter sp.]